MESTPRKSCSWPLLWPATKSKDSRDSSAPDCMLSVLVSLGQRACLSPAGELTRSGASHSALQYCGTTIGYGCLGHDDPGSPALVEDFSIIRMIMLLYSLCAKIASG